MVSEVTLQKSLPGACWLWGLSYRARRWWRPSDPWP